MDARENEEVIGFLPPFQARSRTNTGLLIIKRKKENKSDSMFKGTDFIERSRQVLGMNNHFHMSQFSKVSGMDEQIVGVNASTIHDYRETERAKRNQSNTQIINRIRSLCFPPAVPQLRFVHILDLAMTEVIKPHIDSFCGNTIAGLSLLSDSIMRLRHDVQKDFYRDGFLSRLSPYVMREFVRYEFTHEILGEKTSKLKDKVICRDRRTSVICRNEPENSSTEPEFKPLTPDDISTVHKVFTKCLLGQPTAEGASSVIFRFTDNGITPLQDQIYVVYDILINETDSNPQLKVLLPPVIIQLIDFGAHALHSTNVKEGVVSNCMEFGVKCLKRVFVLSFIEISKCRRVMERICPQFFLAVPLMVESKPKSPEFGDELAKCAQDFLFFAGT
ncbi:unnamed protein product [Orchesella dallaii]|uniref:Uncharacterized protein n=1 Tax=Orchesella dallaii TaxID=48710 RepID=A0ABP1QM56_9HEXA